VTKAYLEKMNAEINANREVIKACQEVAEAWLEK
jgi:hypothetical protein